MKILNAKKTITILNQIMKYELSGVVRYTHYSLMVSGRDRLSLNQFFQEQASESLLHAQQAGELVTGLDGHPSLEISIINGIKENSSLFPGVMLKIIRNGVYIKPKLIKSDKSSLG